MRNLLIIFALFVFASVVNEVDAEVLFEDNFDSYPNGTFPTSWVAYNSPGETPCSESWKTFAGTLNIRLTQNQCSSHIIPNSMVLPNMLGEYILETDIRFSGGTDRHIAYWLNPSTHGMRVLHFFSPGDFSVDTDNPVFFHVGKNYLYDHTYRFKIVVTPTNLKVYSGENLEDLDLVHEVNHINPLPPGIIGFGSSPGGGGTTETWFDNVRITTLDHVDPQPEPGLPVPLLKQTDTLWGNDVYDSANLWSSDGTTISRWGCAVTSASMVFQYNGLNTMVDNSDLNPGSINQWLKTQADGYVRGGLLNWLSLSRLSKQISEINSAPFDALEYESRSVDNELLTNRIENSVPAILSVPGHFIVAKGVDVPNATYWINDPFYAVSSLSDPTYNNSYSRMGIYTQSNTDLSYIMLVVEPHVEIELLDNAGDPIETEVAVEMINDAEGDSINSEGPIKILYAKKPNSGEYQLYLKSAEGGDYTIDQYFYDQGGEVKKMSMVGNLTPGGTDEYKLTFDKDNSSLSFSEKVSIVTFESVKSKIVEAFGERKIKNKLAYYALITELELARKARTNFVKRLFLDLMIITISKSKTIDKTFGQELTLDIKTLQSSL